jgi:uncharacterized membrane protein YqaE (UPF0057 family)
MKKNVFKKLLFLVSFFAIATQLPAAVGVPAMEPTTATTATNEKTPMPSVKELVNSFKELPRSERKARIKEVKKELKEYKRQKQSGAAPIADRTLIIILAILIPPLGVYLYEGEINSKFWISLLLTLLFFIPGMIYSLLVVTGNA